jgi:hypothetical protein
VATIKKGASEVAFGEQITGSQANPAPRYVATEGGRMEEIKGRAGGSAGGNDRKQA